MRAQIEVEEECITNKLMKRLEALKREKQVTVSLPHKCGTSHACKECRQKMGAGYSWTELFQTSMLPLPQLQRGVKDGGRRLPAMPVSLCFRVSACRGKVSPVFVGCPAVERTLSVESCVGS